MTVVVTNNHSYNSPLIWKYKLFQEIFHVPSYLLVASLCATIILIINYEVKNNSHSIFIDWKYFTHIISSYLDHPKIFPCNLVLLMLTFIQHLLAKVAAGLPVLHGYLGRNFRAVATHNEGDPTSEGSHCPSFLATSEPNNNNILFSQLSGWHWLTCHTLLGELLQ